MDKKFIILSGQVTTQTKELFDAQAKKRKMKKGAYLMKLIYDDAKKEVIRATPDTPDSTVKEAQKFLYSSQRSVPLSPSIKKHAPYNFSCGVAWLHYHVVNSLGSRSVPGKAKIKTIAFEISSDDVLATKRYLEYFRKEIIPLRNIATNTTMYDLAKKLRKRIKQLE